MRKITVLTLYFFLITLIGQNASVLAASITPDNGLKNPNWSYVASHNFGEEDFYSSNVPGSYLDGKENLIFDINHSRYGVYHTRLEFTSNKNNLPLGCGYEISFAPTIFGGSYVILKGFYNEPFLDIEGVPGGAARDIKITKVGCFGQNIGSIHVYKTYKPANDPVLISNPRNNEVHKENMLLKWKVQPLLTITPSTVKIEISLDGGYSWDDVETVPAWQSNYEGEYLLNLNRYRPSTQAMVRISANDSGMWGEYAYSPLFTIQTVMKQSILTPTSGQMVSDLQSFIPTVSVMGSASGNLSLSYFIDAESTPRDTKVISNTATAQQVNFNALNVQTLSEGMHTMKFTVNDGAQTIQDTVAFQVDKNAPAVGIFQATATDTTIQVTGTATDTVSGLHALPHRFTIGTSATDWLAAGTHTATSLIPNTNYTVKFEARDAVGHIGSQTKSVQTKAQSPSLVLGQANESSLEVTFQDGNPAGTQYQLKAGSQYVNGSGGLSSTAVWFTPTNKKIRVTGLTSNTTLVYQTKAKNALGEETGWSSTRNGETLASPPAVLTPEASQRYLRISWPTTGGTVTYEIEVDGAVINNGASNTYLHSSLTPNTRHTYRVRVKNGSGAGSWSPQLVAFTLPDPPTAPLEIQVAPSQKEQTITWGIVARADSYDIEVDGVVIEAGSVLRYVHAGLEPETQHTYRIRAKNTGGISEWSALITSQTLPYPPQKPITLTAEPSIHEMAVSWEAVAGATGYEIEVDGLILDNANRTSYLHKKLEALSPHTYRIRATNAGGKSAWSEPLETVTHPEKPAIPTNLIATAEADGNTLTWYKVPHAESYEIEIDGSTIMNVTTNQYTHTGLVPNKAYAYRVRAVNISGHSEWGSKVTLTALPNQQASDLALTNVAAVVTNRSITVSWETVAMDAHYEVEVDGVLTDNGLDTIYHHGGLKANEFHTYKIRLKQEGTPANWIAVLSLSTLPDSLQASIEVEAVANNNSIELRWDQVEGASGYDIEVDGQTVASTETSTTYTDTGLESGTSHTYRVRAKNEAGVTVWSPAIVKSTTSPSYIVNGVKGKTFDLSLLGSNVQDFSELTYVVTYDASALEVVDLYDFTPARDTQSGKIAGSNLEVTYTPGRITYKKSQNIVPGTSWSGEVTTIIFKSKMTGQTTIDVKV
ncbi:hypothetical protein SAMN04487969_13428 [Paenibacillus algorifonticola]|uniref:Fibronectin type-III domain-containing protein n=1 Tax=Paenibacillus algorifonticola TaxID=684063 RepID=A0A1I2IHL4_9BACL|nr:hypothetical protein SAMN04487969_13428 [Paenibacillus algorifonticola]